MYTPTDNEGDGDDMDGADESTDDMDAKSTGMVLKALDHEQAGVVRRCEREILRAARSLWGSRGACKRERKVAINRVVSEVYLPARCASAATPPPPPYFWGGTTFES